MSGKAGGGLPAALLPDRLVAVERAVGDLRHGLGVVIEGAEPGPLFCLSAELINDARLAALREMAGGPPELALTHERAATLKIRLYTPDVVLLPLGQDNDAGFVRALADPGGDLANPMRGPFAARRDGAGPAHVAAVKLAKIARLLPAAIVVAPPASPAAAVRVSAEDVLAYEIRAAQGLERVTSARVPLAGAEEARIVAFRPRDGGIEHLAIIVGAPRPPGPVLARIHSECFTGDLLGSLKCDCGDQLRGAIAEIAKAGNGLLLYLAQEGRGIGLINKLRAYALQDQGYDTIEANQRLGFESDERIFLPAAEMLRRLGFTKIRLMTNNPDKVAALEGYGITVAERVPHAFPSNDHNAFYLSTKKDKSGHLL